MLKNIDGNKFQEASKSYLADFGAGILFWGTIFYAATMICCAVTGVFNKDSKEEEA